MTATGLAPGAASSDAESSRPRSGRAPRSSKKLPLTRAPVTRSAWPPVERWKASASSKAAIPAKADASSR